MEINTIIIAVVAAILVAIIVTIIIVHMRNKKNKQFVQECDINFINAIMEFNNLCNPSTPMTAEQWQQFSNKHQQNFLDAQQYTTNKKYQRFITDPANANTLIEIFQNHQSYINNARRSYDNIKLFENNITKSESKVNSTFDHKHNVPRDEANQLHGDIKETVDAAQYCLDNSLESYLTQPDKCKWICGIYSNIEKHRKDNNSIFHLNKDFPNDSRLKEDTFNGSHYVAKSEADALKQRLDTTIKNIKHCLNNNLSDFLIDKDAMKNLLNFFAKYEDNRKTHNYAFVASELEHNKDYFDKLLQYPLDNQQRRAVVNGEDNCLVVSSAGSGKTSTINAKVKYLIEKLDVYPEDILLISFTRKATEELRKRIGYDGLNCKTFHSLARGIIAEVTGEKPSISADSFAVNVFYQMLKNKEFKEAVTYYLLYFLSLAKIPHQYATSQEFYSDRMKYGRQAYFTDMDGGIIFTKSEQERRICHFLSTHDVKFRYEEPYEYAVATKQKQQYKPDFSIYYEDENGVTHRLYLEHFGIDSKGNVPTWFGAKNGWTYQKANMEYRNGIKWKRNVHAENGTILLETTSAMFTDLTWESVLASQLMEHGVKLTAEDASVTYDKIVRRDKHKEKTILELITSFIALMKANCRSITDIENNAQKFSDTRTLYIVRNIIMPFYNAYQQGLRKNGEMDFTDMILKATDFCENGSYSEKYKYIIVDEFQDISFDRYKFLLSLRQQPFGKIFVVGDDWQSIYRFAGSDLGLFSDFEKYFGFTSQCKIESTYRFGQPAIDISSDFIQKNASQVKKNVKSPLENLSTTIECQWYNNDNDLASTVAETIRQIPTDKSIYIISRYVFDFAIFKSDPSFKYHEKEDDVEITVDNRTIRCLTVHKAKGLEADYVLLLKCNSDIYGFPSMISDDPVLNYVLSEQEESIEFAEERRLFYVAITRAKLKTTVFYKAGKPSIFVNELTTALMKDDRKICPYCGYGHVQVRKQGQARNGNHYVCLGCTNAQAGCDYFETKFFDTPITDELINKLTKVQLNRPNNDFTGLNLNAQRSNTRDTRAYLTGFLSQSSSKRRNPYQFRERNIFKAWENNS